MRNRLQRSIGRNGFASLLVPSILTGCSPAPTQNILGSYFPSWIFCVLAGLVITLIARKVLVAMRIDKSLPAPFLVYLAMTTAFAFAVWLLWLG